MAQERRPAQIRWIEEHRCTLMGLAAAIVAQAEHYQLPDEDREWIDELAVDAGDAAWTPATMADKLSNPDPVPSQRTLL